MAEVKVTKVTQKLDESLSSDLSLDPKYVINYFVDNIVSRTISYLMAWDRVSNTPVKLSATSDGLLKVSTVPVVYQYNDVKAGSAGDTWSAPIQFDQVVGRIDVWVWDNAALLQRSIDGTTFQDTIEIPANTMYSFDASTYSVKIQNKTAGSTARYQIIGWY